jgi:hypothetical protein
MENKQFKVKNILDFTILIYHLLHKLNLKEVSLK